MALVLPQAAQASNTLQKLPPTLDRCGRIQRQRVQPLAVHTQHVCNEAGGDVAAVNGATAPVVTKPGEVVCM